MLASSPNIAHYRVVGMLVRGRFTLSDRGVMDRTHLRWFTPYEYRRLFEDAGYATLRIYGHGEPGARARAVARVGRGRLDHLIWRQIEIQAIREPVLA